MNERGGEELLPEIVSGTEVSPILGARWYADMRRMGMLPGLRACPGGVWRCERSAFLSWLKLLAGEMPPPLLDDFYEQ
ncbi:MAG: hypothetical protein WCG26_10850 [Chloroflexales bacterium]